MIFDIFEYLKNKIIKVKSIENEEVIIAITRTKIIITTVIMKKTILMMIMKRKIRNRIKI